MLTPSSGLLRPPEEKQPSHVSTRVPPPHDGHLYMDHSEILRRRTGLLLGDAQSLRPRGHVLLLLPNGLGPHLQGKHLVEEVHHSAPARKNVDISFANKIFTGFLLGATLLHFPFFHHSVSQRQLFLPQSSPGDLLDADYFDDLPFYRFLYQNLREKEVEASLKNTCLQQKSV